jgi:hypothetical protein
VRYMKTLVLLGLVAVVMMALANPAWGDYASTTTGGAPGTPTIHLVNENGHLSIHNGEEVAIDCTSTIAWTVEDHGAGKPVSGNVSSLSFTGCTNGWAVTVNARGSLSIEHTSGHNGTLRSSGTTITATRTVGLFHITCRYRTENTTVGTLTGGNPATLHVEGRLPFHSGSGACGEEPHFWTGDYVATGALYVGDTYTPPSPVITSPTGTAGTSPVHLVSEGGHISIHNPEANIECASTLEATLETTGAGTASGLVDALSFTGCTNGWSVSVQAAGELEVHATSGYNGTVTSSGATITGTLDLFFFHVTCRYKTANTTVGTLTGGNPATLHIEGKIPFHSGSAACGKEPSQMTGDYETAEALYIDPPVAVTSPTGTAGTSPVHLVSEGGHISIHNPEANIECASTLEATLETTGAGTASGLVDALSFTGCTNGWSVSVQAAGELEVHATSGYNGTVTSSGATITGTLDLFFFHVTCRYKTANTTVGTLTGGNPATLHIEGKIPFHSGSAACGKEPSQMTGDYETAEALYIDS